MTFEGHSRSAKISRFDKAHMTSYYRSIVIMALSCMSRLWSTKVLSRKIKFFQETTKNALQVSMLILPFGHADCEVIFTPLKLSSQVLSTGVCKIIETLKNLAILAQIYT